MNFDHSCRWVRFRLPLLAGGELAMRERREVERHLIGCPDCRARRDTSASALAVLRLAGSESVSSPDAPSLWPALARQIRESKHASPRTAWWDLPSPRAWGLAGLASAMGVLLVASASPTPIGLEGPPSVPATTALVEPSPNLDFSPSDVLTMAAGPTEFPRPSALPQVPASKAGELAQAPWKPVEPPSSILSFDYDLDHGTPMGPGSHDPQRTY
jgi:hypothetical protein